VKEGVRKLVRSTSPLDEKEQGRGPVAVTSYKKRKKCLRTNDKKKGGKSSLFKDQTGTEAWQLVCTAPQKRGGPTLMDNTVPRRGGENNLPSSSGEISTNVRGDLDSTGCDRSTQGEKK